jgi:serine/threonine protein phosphatase PrpC
MTKYEDMEHDFFMQLKNCGAEGYSARASILARTFGIDIRHIREILLEWGTDGLISLEVYSKNDSRFRPFTEFRNIDEFFEYANDVGYIRVRLLAAGAEYLDRLNGMRHPVGAPIAERLSSWLARPTKSTAFVDLPELPASIGTTIGEVRRENQDRAIIVRFASNLSREHSFVACLLADGMGGMADGARCAEIALGTFVDALIRNSMGTIENRLRASTEAANARVYRQFRHRGGTTIVGLIFSDREVAGVSAGDSRLHSFSPSGRLHQISIDDTIAEQVKRVMGSLPTDDQADTFAEELVQFIGMGDGIEPRIYPLNPTAAGERYLISSDGAHSVAFDTLESVVIHAPSLSETARRAIFLSNWCGGKDNASVICIDPKMTSTLTARLRPDPGLLEIWDSFGKLELCIEAASGPNEMVLPRYGQHFVPRHSLSDKVRPLADQLQPLADRPRPIAERPRPFAETSARSPVSKTRKRQKRVEAEKPPRSSEQKSEPRTLQIEILQAAEIPSEKPETVESSHFASSELNGSKGNEPSGERPVPHESSLVSSPVQLDDGKGDDSEGKKTLAVETSPSSTPPSNSGNRSTSHGQQGDS